MNLIFVLFLVISVNASNFVISDERFKKILFRMFIGENDEHCLRNRGTDYIKSPEMLTIPINCKREADHFDRRRKVFLYESY